VGEPGARLHEERWTDARAQVHGDELDRARKQVWNVRPRYLEVHATASQFSTLLVQAWVEDQLHYHRATAERYQRNSRRFHWATVTLFGLALLVAILHNMDTALGFKIIDPKVLLFLAIALPASAGALTGIAEQRQFRRNAERHSELTHGLERVVLELDCVSSLQGAQDLAYRAGLLLVGENRDWFEGMRERDIEVPG
jgi:hypothetical protein